MQWDSLAAQQESEVVARTEQAVEMSKHEES